MYSQLGSKSFTVTIIIRYYKVTGDKTPCRQHFYDCKYGNSGNPVHLVQLLLKKVGYALADSQFGNTTLSKVKSQGSCINGRWNCW
ncbi:hypothetical protein ACK2IE_22290 [Clostridioides difficile]